MTRRLRLSWIFVATFVLLLQSAMSSLALDEQAGKEDGASQENELKIAQQTVQEWFYGRLLNRDRLPAVLDEYLLQKVSIIDRVCGLTDDQNEKLRLAGRGDNRQIVDRVEKMAGRLALGHDDPDKVKELAAEAQKLKRRLGPGLTNPLDDSSLFFRSVEKILTEEQLDKYQSLKVVMRAGGKVETLRGESDEGLEISFLFLGPSVFSDDDLARLVRVPGIVSLILADTQVTDAGLVHLKRLRRLHSLWLNNTRITDAGLAHLAGLSNLRYLLIARTKVTDAGLAHLKGLPMLAQITLDGTEITDAGLAHLAGLSGIHNLLLRETRVTDAGLARLRSLTELRSLDLDKTAVTDAGLEHLNGLSHLQRLSLRNTAVTDSGVAELRQALPDLKITVDK